MQKCKIAIFPHLTTDQKFVNLKKFKTWIFDKINLKIIKIKFDKSRKLNKAKPNSFQFIEDKTTTKSRLIFVGVNYNTMIQMHLMTKKYDILYLEKMLLKHSNKEKEKRTKTFHLIEVSLEMLLQ